MNENRTKTFPNGCGILRLLRFRFASTNEMAYRRTRSKKFTNERYFPQIGKRYRNARQSRESHFQYENGHKGYERFAKFGDNSRDHTDPVRYDHFKTTRSGI